MRSREEGGRYLGIIIFLIGYVVGVWFGIICTALVVAAGDEDIKRLEEEYEQIN